jgi:hypothetical protein
VATTTVFDIKEFAIKVERLCDFLLDRVVAEVGRTGDDDMKILEDLKEEAANIHMVYAPNSYAITGLDQYMRGQTQLQGPIKEL